MIKKKERYWNEYVHLRQLRPKHLGRQMNSGFWIVRHNSRQLSKQSACTSWLTTRKTRTKHANNLNIFPIFLHSRYGKVKMIVQDGYLLCWTMAFVATQIINVFYLGFVGSKFSGDPYIMIDCSFTVFLLTTKWDYRKMVLYQYDIKYDIIALVG